MATKSCLFFALMVSFLSSCTKQHENKNELAGTWQWERTDGGIANNLHQTPASTGKTIQLRLNADFTYSVHTNGSLTSKGTYILEEKKCIHDSKTKAFINFSSLSDMDLMVESLHNRQLLLSDEALDGVISQYVKTSD